MNDQTLGMAKTVTVTYNNITTYTKKYQCFIINVSSSEKSIVFNTSWQAITQLVSPSRLSTSPHSWGVSDLIAPWYGGRISSGMKNSVAKILLPF